MSRLGVGGRRKEKGGQVDRLGKLGPCAKAPQPLAGYNVTDGGGEGEEVSADIAQACPLIGRAQITSLRTVQAPGSVARQTRSWEVGLH